MHIINQIIESQMKHADRRTDTASPICFQTEHSAQGHTECAKDRMIIAGI
jgi:hypothetical protein